MGKSAASVTQQAIRAISAGAVSLLLAPVGFKRRSPHFWRETDGIYQAVHFQASQWGTSSEGSFTVNLGISSPTLYASFTGREFPKNPATVLWPVSARIGSLMPSHCDLWWEVSERTDLDTLGIEVASALRDHALPYLDRIRTPDQFNTLLLGEQPIPGVTAAQRPLIGATLAIDIGEYQSARRMLEEALAKHLGKPFESTVRNVARRLDLQLNGAN
jgi:hypothetical protein